MSKTGKKAENLSNKWKFINCCAFPLAVFFFCALLFAVYTSKGLECDPIAMSVILSFILIALANVVYGLIKLYRLTKFDKDFINCILLLFGILIAIGCIGTFLNVGIESVIYWFTGNWIDAGLRKGLYVAGGISFSLTLFYVLHCCDAMENKREECEGNVGKSTLDGRTNSKKPTQCEQPKDEFALPINSNVQQSVGEVNSKTEANFVTNHIAQPQIKQLDPTYCMYCGSKLPDTANYCAVCGVAIVRMVEVPAPPANSQQNTDNHVVEKNSAKKEKRAIDAPKDKGTYILRILEERFSLRKAYRITDAKGEILYVAKSEGMPKKPELVIYANDREVGRVEKLLLTHMFLQNKEYEMSWYGTQYASLCRRKALKVVYDVPEKGWEYEIGVVASKLRNRKGEVLAETRMLTTSGRDLFAIEYYNRGLEPAAVLFALVMAMRVDLQ